MNSLVTNRVIRLTFLALAALVALTLVMACGGSEPTVAPTSTPVPAVVPRATLAPVQTPVDVLSPTPDALATKVWDTAVMLAEGLSPRESATDEELRAAEYLAGRFSGWGYEVGLQDFEAVEISAAPTRLVVLGPGDAVEGLSRLGYRDGEQGLDVCLFRWTRHPWPRMGTRWKGQMAYAGLGDGRGLLAGVDVNGQDRADRGGWGGVAEGEGGGGGGSWGGSGGDIQ